MKKLAELLFLQQINKIQKKLQKLLRCQKGFSLLETVVTLGIVAIIIVTITQIIIANLTAARRVKARSYVREELTFAANLLKKDIRNAESITCPSNNQCPANVNTSLFCVTLRENEGIIKSYLWYSDSNSLERYNVSNCSNLYQLDGSYSIPSDIEKDVSGGFKVSCSNKNCSVSVVLKGTTNGMPIKGGQKTYVTKEIFVKTRNFNF